MEDNRIRIKSNDLPAVEINLDKVEKISLPGGYGNLEESIKDISNELAGNAKKNFIIVSNGTIINGLILS